MVFLSRLFSENCRLDRTAEDAQFRIERKKEKGEKVKTLRCAGCPFPSSRTLSRSIIYMFCLPFLTLLKLEAELGVSFAKIRLAHLFGSH
jgi:hypothetical protein